MSVKTSLKGIELYLCVMGSVRLKTVSGDDLRLPYKAVALITYLVLSQSNLATKEFIKGLLWSESSQGRASGSLRQCLKKLNDTFDSLNFSAFSSDGRDIRLQLEFVRVDVFELHNRLQTGQMPAESEEGTLSPGSLFNDLDGQDQSLDSWLSVQRKKWSDKLLGELEKQIRSVDHHSERGIESARLVFAFDRTHEEACRFMMKFYAGQENLGPVMEIYSQLCTELDEKFGSEPSPETVELYLSIQNNSFEIEKSKPVTVGVVVSQSSPIIGVNAFQWSGPSSEKSEMLATGFRKEMLAALSKFREWVVIDTESRKVSQHTVSDIDYVVDGTCFHVDEFTEVLITLTDSKTGQLWSETPRIETQSWIAAQRTIVSKVAVALNVYLSAGRLTNTVPEPIISASAHEEWLRGYQNMLVWDSVAERKAEVAFQRLVEGVPDYAPAYSSLATLLNTQHFKNVGTRRNTEDTLAALSLALKSVELDPLESRAQLALGFSYAMNEQFDLARLHLTLARELNPLSPVSLVPCAHGLSYCGLHEEARQLVDWAENINWRWMPRFHWGYILCVRFLAKDFTGAIRAAKMADGVIVDLYAWHAAALAMDGRLDEAAAMVKIFVDLATERWVGVSEPTEHALAAWFLHSFPIRLEEDYELLKEGLARAGLSDTAP